MFIPTPSPPKGRDEVTISFSLHLGMEGERLTEVCTNFTPLPSQGWGVKQGKGKTDMITNAQSIDRQTTANHNS